jgi:hypothetical protein
MSSKFSLSAEFQGQKIHKSINWGRGYGSNGLVLVFVRENTCPTRCVMKHKCPRTRQIPEVGIIVKSQGQDFKIYGSNIKILSQALSLTIQTIWPKLKFLKSGSNFKVTRSKIMVPLESSCHKEHTYVWNTKALSLTIRKIWPMLKFLKSGSNFKVTRSKHLVPIERFCQKEQKYKIWKPSHLPFKRYGQC